MKEYALKAAVAATLAGVAAYFNALLVPVVIVAVIMLCDYLSGLAAAWVNNEVSSRVGIVGIVKKIAHVLIIVVGIAVDWVIQIAAESVGLEPGRVYYFALLVIVWLIMNECISILENVARLGVNVPPFLLKLTQKLKASAESNGVDSLE